MQNNSYGDNIFDEYDYNKNYTMNNTRNNYFNSFAKRYVNLNQDVYIDVTNKIENILIYFEDSIRKSKNIFLSDNFKRDIISYTKLVYDILKKDKSEFREKYKKIKLKGVFCIIVFLLFKVKFCKELYFNLDLQEIINSIPTNSIKCSGNLFNYLSKIKNVIKKENLDLITKLKDIDPQQQLNYIIENIIDYLIKIDFLQEYILNFDKTKILKIIDQIINYRKIYDEKLINVKTQNLALALIIITFKMNNIHLNSSELAEKINKDNITNINYNSCNKIIEKILNYFFKDFSKISKIYQNKPLIINNFKKISKIFILFYKLFIKNKNIKKLRITDINSTKLIKFMLNKYIANFNLN